VSPFGGSKDGQMTSSAIEMFGVGTVGVPDATREVGGGEAGFGVGKSTSTLPNGA
jgi:hypothetical protein